MDADVSQTLARDLEFLKAAKAIDPAILQYFRLLEHPYRGGPDFRYLFTTDQVKEAITQSIQLTISRTSPLYLYGRFGIGKTTIITRLYALLLLDVDFDVKFLVLDKGVTKNWLIRKIAEAFNVKTARSYNQTLENVHTYLNTVAGTQKVPTLLIDEGQYMNEDCLATLHSLFNDEDNKVKYCQIVIAGQEPLAEKISALGEMDSRMRSIEIAPMTPDELRKMFQYRWQVAGGKEEDFPFMENDTEAFTIIFKYSKGLPRDAIKVGDEILKYLSARGKKKINTAEVEEIAKKTLAKKKKNDTEQ
jgi:type II secretory pathway predicted ATPase ExeA